MEEEKTLTPDIKDEILKNLESSKEKMLDVGYSRDEYNRLFPRGYVRTPVGSVKLGEHQFERLGEKDGGKRAWLLGALYQTLKTPLAIIKDVDRKGRPAKLFIKPLIDGESRRRYMVSIIPTIDGMQIAVSSGLRKEKQIKDKIKMASSFYYSAEGGGLTTGTAQGNVAQHD